MVIGILKDIKKGENRVIATPGEVATLIGDGNTVKVQKGAGEKAGFEDDFVTFYNTHLGTSCDGAGIGLKFADAYGDLTFCNGIVKTEDGVISCTIDIRVPVTLKEEELRSMC